jgi:hypothetical protein
MQTRVFYRAFFLALAAVMAVLPAKASDVLPTPTPWPTPTAVAAPVNTDMQDPPAVRPAEDFPVPTFIPVLMRKFRPHASMLGVAIEGFFDAAGWQQTLGLHPHLVRRWQHISWRDIEPQPGQYDWSKLAGLEAELKNAAAMGVEPILNIQITPEWAQKVQGNTCGPIAADKFDAFATFMEQLVRRYGPATEYGVRYWQIGNEPDIAVGIVPGDSVFGCWGDRSDPYYGGGYYGEMLKVVYTRIKAVDPQTQVMVGGLLLECDPYTMSVPDTCKNEDRLQSGYFLEGILKAGAGDYFDVLDIHGYGEVRSDLPSHMHSYYHWSPPQGGTGLPEKVAFVRRLLAQYGQPDKTIMATELALKCEEPGPNCEDAGAAYIPRVVAEAYQLGLAGTVYYALITEFKYKGLLLPDLTPKPQYLAYDYLASQLSWVEYVKPVSAYPGVSGAEFNQSRLRRLWIIWSSDGTDQVLTLPADFVQAYDKYGNVVPLTDGKLVVGWSPIYVELKIQNK